MMKTSDWVSAVLFAIVIGGVSGIIWAAVGEIDEDRGFAEACAIMGGSAIKTLGGDRVCTYLPEIDPE